MYNEKIDTYLLTIIFNFQILQAFVEKEASLLARCFWLVSLTSK